MSLTPSNMMPLGAVAPEFKLLDTVSNKKLTLADVKSDKALVVMFICNHCPFVIHVQDELVKLAHDYQPKGVNFVAISANDAEAYPQDGPNKMRERAQEKQFPFPYLYDETQATAKAYDAACTPDLYVFDEDLKCVYRGQLDDSRPNNGKPVTGKDLRAALDAVLAGKPVNPDQRPSAGCNIKWK